MTPLDYLGFIIALICSGLLGQNITKNSHTTSVLAGLCISGTILAITAWFIPLYSKHIVFILFIVSLRNLPQNFANLHLSLKKCFTSLAPVVVSLVIFRHFSSIDYFYNNHDPAYWGYTFELLHADYFGPTRVPTFYPENFSPTHILPQTMLVTLLAFSKNASLASIIEAKYLIISILFGGFFQRLTKEIPTSTLTLIGSTILALVIYESELGYNLLISSYLYTFLLIEIFILSISKKPNELELLFFSLMLIIARGPIFYVGATLALYYWYVFNRYRYQRTVVLTATAVLGVMMTWAYFPSALERVCQDLSFNIMNPFDLNQLISLTGIRLWALPDTLVMLLLKSTEDIHFTQLAENPYSPETYRALASVLPFLGYYILKYYMPIILGLWFLLRTISLSNVQQVKLKGIALYASVSLIGWLFVRNGWQVAHQTHNYLLASILSLSLVLVCCAIKPRSFALLIPITFIFTIDRGLSERPFQRTFEMGIPKNHIRYNPDVHGPMRNSFYTPRSGESMWETEVIALLSGSRVRGTDYDPVTLDKEFFGSDTSMTSIMPMWVVTAAFPTGCEYSKQTLK